MSVTPHEHFTLASLTTFHIGGPARYAYLDIHESALDEVIAFAREQHLPLRMLGAGSNVLIPDEGVAGVVVRLAHEDPTYVEQGTSVIVRAGAGLYWDTLVRSVGERGLYGIENLAGIPGTLGGAAVQNIGAYGAELATTFLYADTVHRETGERRRVSREEAVFGYRTSLFKSDRSLIVTHVALSLRTEGTTDCTYADLARAKEAGIPCDTPRTCAQAVRTIRAGKFPDATEGTAGSFFKNPVLTSDAFSSLKTQYPELPGFVQAQGDVKVPLAWILDHVLDLKGFTRGLVRLYEKQPLIVVAHAGASSADVDAFAALIAEKVFAATHIQIEREVELFSV